MEMSSNMESDPFLNRSVYHFQTLDERLEECLVITDTIDELFAAGINVGSTVPDRPSVSEASGMSRSFRYIEGDKIGGWAWPLVEKTLDLTYDRSNLGLISEVYTVMVGDIIHQVGLTKNPIASKFTIAYCGQNRRFATSTVEEHNFTDENLPDVVVRPTTPYDQGLLFDELASVQALIDIQSTQDARAAKAAQTPPFCE